MAIKLLRVSLFCVCSICTKHKTQKHFTQQFTDEWLGFKRLKVINVFSSSNEDDGTPGGCNTDRKQKKKKCQH